MSLTFCANSCCSVKEGAGGAAAVGALTVTRAVASCVPPAPLAVRRYVVESSGVTAFEPLVSTGPMPSILTSVALVVCQVRVVDCPFCTESGFAEREAVGAGGAGGGGGGGGAAFFLHALTIRIALNTSSRVSHRFIGCFTSFLQILCA